jgi:hypothetical protein
MELPRKNNDELLTCLAALALYDGEVMTLFASPSQDVALD